MPTNSNPNWFDSVRVCEIVIFFSESTAIETPMFCPFLPFIPLFSSLSPLLPPQIASEKYLRKSYISLYIYHVHYSPEVSFLPAAIMTSPVLSPTTIADPATTQGEVDKPVKQSKNADFKSSLPRDFGFLPVPRHLRYDPTKPFHFGLLLNIAFGLASTFIVANLYYCQPLLIQLSIAFDVSFSEVSRIPTLVQAGYATGLVLISPLGDLMRRRQLILCIVALSTSLTIGLAVTRSLQVFETLSYLVGVVTVTPQILIPLAADLAPEKKRAAAISIVLSGLLFGILLARVLAGIIAEFTSWRVVYYFAVGMQALVLVGSYLMLPDYPSKNKDLTYWNILWTMAKFSVTEPILIQASLIFLALSACYSNFWVTLTFLLGGPPYHYSTLVIGLFGLIGMVGVTLGPFVGRGIDNLVPWYASLFAILVVILFLSIQTGAGGISVAAVVMATIGIDVFTQMIQVSLATAVFAISLSARSRLNAVMILSIFIGQVIGTSVGTQVFVKFGWRAAAALNMVLYGFQIFILLLRGPHCRQYTWFGYEGGLEPRKSVIDERKRLEAEQTTLPSGKERECIDRKDKGISRTDETGLGNEESEHLD